MTDNSGSSNSNSNSKRNSIAGKVATPKTGGGSPAMQPLADPLETLGKAIGARVRVTTAAPHSQTLEGTLFTADPILNLVAVNTRSPTYSASANAALQSADYHVIPVSRIQNFQVLSLAEGGDGSLASAQYSIAPVDIKVLKKREEARVNKLKEEKQDRGQGVSKEGQAIFDALKRINTPVRWHAQGIIAHEAVIIHPPYRPEDCKGTATNPDVVALVRRVLEGERRKLKEREDKERKAATPAGPRKGG